MPEMTESELLQIVNTLESDTLAYNDEFMRENEELLAAYNQEPYGDEEDGRSSVISTDVANLVDSDMTSLVRIFLGSGDVMVFSPTTDSEEAIQENKDKTKYINWLIRERPQQYKVIHDWMKDAEIQKMGVIYYYLSEEKKTEEREFKGLDPIELAEAQEAMKGDGEVEIIEQEETDEGFNLKYKITRVEKKIVTDNIATEDFLISKQASSKEDANAVGHVDYPTRGELVAEGYSKERVAKLDTGGQGLGGERSGNNTANRGISTHMKELRFDDQGGYDLEAYTEWATEPVVRITLYAKIDYDGDGVAERRFIQKVGNDILENEPFDHVPYAILTGFPEPHKAIGKGRGELVVQDQWVKTVLMRGMLDNTYMVQNPRNAISDKVDLDDMLDVVQNGVVRVKGGLPGNEIFPMSTQYIGQETLQVIQYMDGARAQKAGTLLASQGLNTDDLGKETATRFEGIKDNDEAKIELVARNFAELGFLDLFDGVAWMATHYQDTIQEVMIMGRPLSIKPTDWKHDHVLSSQVGLGAGDGKAAVENMVGIMQIQDKLKASGSLLVDEKKLYNALDKMSMGLGLARTSDFFNDPEVPDQLLKAQNEQLTAALGETQQMLEQMSNNPLAEAETIKAQAKIASDQASDALAAAKFDVTTELNQMKMIQDGAQFDAEQTFKYTELELDNNVDIPGEGKNG